jgi:uncharacterized protein with ATP-grasp and redox domains
MIRDYRCFFCFLKAIEKRLEKESLSKERKGLFISEMIKVYQKNPDNFSSPDVSHEIRSVLRDFTGNSDPYRSEKSETNEQARKMLPELSKIIDESSDRFNTALRIAIAGNVIDFAANDQFNLRVTLNKALKNDIAIDRSEKLKRELEKARSVLYLGDNAGEIIFDKFFIREMRHPNVIYTVRGGPVLNDATLEDAEFAGIKEVANVISSGYDAPSTILDKSSEDFKNHFKKADIIISKGQGNLEGLFNYNDTRIFYLLLVKCDVIAELLKVKKDSMVVYNHS